MRILLVEPGPAFSVADVCRGWRKGLVAAGVEVFTFNFSDRLSFYGGAHLEDPDTGDYVKAFDDRAATHLAAKGIEVACYELQPDVVLVVSGFFVPLPMLDLIRDRGSRVVLLHTESPYEDERQLRRAAHVDLNLINDPTNLETFRAVASTYYMPHAYDPDFHCPGPVRPECVSDFCFVGTGYQSRIDFFEQVDWTGIDVALAGAWQALENDSPLRKFLAHDVEVCCDNEEAVDLYRATRASANLYRREAEAEHLAAGWSMGPREVELAACGTFYLTEERGENREVLPMIPTFDGPGDFEEQFRWWLTHDDERARCAAAARDAIAPRTFTNHARVLLGLLDNRR